MTDRHARGRKAQKQGIDAETLASDALTRDGWSVLARRLRTGAGEIDIVAEKTGTLAFVEVKSRSTLSDAAAALGPRQRARLMSAAEIALGTHPEWQHADIRFDVILVDAASCVRRVADAFRAE